jgi:glycosyltransferase involved in cell wall biosynthesis
MQRLYEGAYGLPSGRMLVATPPMARILAPMRRGGGGSAWAGGPPPPRGTPAAGLRGDAEGSAPLPLRLLVYGRLARMKGSETVARAAALIQAGLPPGTPLELHFAGGDWECSLHARPTSQCVLEALERGGEGRNVRSVFLGAVDRAKLANTVPAFHGAVIASEFETFNLAAHELAATGIPLVVSNIPALAAFFSPQNAYVFEPGDEKSLAAAALVLAADLAQGAPRVAALDYEDPLEPYGRVVSAARRGELPSSLADTVMEEAAIDRTQAGCWHEEACSSECKKRWAALSSATPETLRKFFE